MTGTIFLETAEFSIGETDNVALIPIVRTGDLSGEATVEYGVTADNATAGTDFVSTDGFVTFAAGQDRVLVSVDIKDDALAEDTETFVLSLITVDSGILLAPRTTRVNILDDENPVTPSTTPELSSDFDVVRDTVIEGLDRPLSMEFAPQDSSLVYIAEKGGRVRVFDLDTQAYQADFIDLSAVVNDVKGSDRGLMDIAFHPGFPEEPFFYAFYVVDPAEAADLTGDAGIDGAGNRYSHVVKFTADPATNFTTAVPDSGEIIVGGSGQSASDISGGGAIDSTSAANLALRASDVDQDGNYVQDYLKVDSRSHAGGSLEFGPDGALYISVGDGVSYNVVDPRAVSVQSVDALAGKILRVDPLTGDGLADNPFAEPEGSLDQNSAKVFQLGLRNPFSMSFDQEGKLILTDTGWYAYEEINMGGPGANFGWPFYEGDEGGQLLKSPGYRDLPEAQAFYAAVEAGEIEITAAFNSFAHADAKPGYQVQAIVGADDLISSDLYPEELQNNYIFVDFSQGEVFAVDSNDRRDVKFLYQSDSGRGPVHIKQGPDGHIYTVDLIKGTIEQLKITKLDDTGGFTAEYFEVPAVDSLDEIDFTATPDATDTVRQIQNARTEASFWDGGSSDTFAARFTGNIDVTVAGEYTFYLNSDDGAVLLVNGVEVINNDGLHADVEKQTTIQLAAGENSIEVKYFEKAGFATLELDWDGPDTDGRVAVTASSPTTPPDPDPDPDLSNVINGTEANDYLDGTDGDDTINLLTGRDVVVGSKGSDTIIGDTSSYDQVDYDGASTDYTFTQNDDGTVSVTKSETEQDTLTSVDGFWFKGEGVWKSLEDVLADNGDGNPDPDPDTPPVGGVINGTQGNDYLDGTAGDDTINLLTGKDVVNGSKGNDTIIGDASSYDQVDYDGASTDYTFTQNPDGTVSVTKSDTETDTLTSIDGFWFKGEGVWKPLEDVLEDNGDPDAPPPVGQTINGTNGNDYLSGTAGDDTVNLLAGRDVVNGSKGSDTIIGDASSYDQVDYEGASTDYTFTKNADSTVTVTKSGTETDTLTSVEGFWFKDEEEWYSLDALIPEDPFVV